MMIRILFLLLFLLPTTLFAQGNDCSVENPERCFVDLALFCQGQGEVPLQFRLNLSTFNIDFTAQFSSPPKSKRLPLFFVDGEVESGDVREVRITTLECDGNTCSGTLELDRAEQLETQFDFDQAVINITLRERTKFGRDYCIGKFTNDPDKLADNDGSARQVCTLEPTPGNEAIVADGFFAPAGYGTDGTARFHLAVQGLASDTTYQGCSVIGNNRYKKVFTFTPRLLATAQDGDIYGALSEKEQAEFDANRFLYSYELRRALAEQIDSVELSRTSQFVRENILFTPSLSLINKSVSSSTGAKAVRESNKNTQRARRIAQKRKQKGQSSRGLLALLEPSGVQFKAATAAGTEEPLVELRAKKNERRNERILAWLNFDPLGGTLLISESCVRNVQERAIGSLVCGDGAEGEARRCRTFDFGDDATLRASACREVGESFSQLTLLFRADENKELTVCLNGSALPGTVEIKEQTFIGAPNGPSAELKLTDRSQLALEDDSFTLAPVSIQDITEISLSETGDCGTILGSISFLEFS